MLWVIPLGQKQTKLIKEEQKSQCYFYNSDLTSDKKIIKLETLILKYESHKDFLDLC